MTTQQYPEHILKQAEEIVEQIRYKSNFSPTEVAVRDTLNLPALLMAREENTELKLRVRVLITDLQSCQTDHEKLIQQLSQHQQVVKQLVEALESMFSEMNFEETKILIRTGLNVKYESVKQSLSTAKQLLEKRA